MLLLGSFLAFLYTPEKRSFTNNLGVDTLDSSASTSHGSPEILYNNISIEEYYNSSYSYYYKTDYTVYSSYNVIWVLSNATDDDFDLYLYSNGGYSSLLASSNREPGLLEWIVFRASQAYHYPKVYAYSGSGDAYIEWKYSSISLSLGEPIVNFLNASESIELYQINLVKDVLYNFSLEVPAGGDFDLYIYYLTTGEATNFGGFFKSSTTSGMGVNEQILNFNPSVSGDYAVLVVRKSGSGVFTLNCSTTYIVPTRLSDDSPRYEYYNASSSYYYRIDEASVMYYHIIWVQPVSSNSNFDLSLYNNPQYQAPALANSTNGNGSLDWIIWRPSVSQPYYPLINTNIQEGYAYIEWEDSSAYLSTGSTYSYSFTSSDFAELYYTYLSSNTIYNVHLIVPETADYDLYLYYLEAGEAINGSEYLRAGTSIGMGINEKIESYRPAITGYYAILIIRKNGTASYSISVNSPTTLYNYYQQKYYYESLSYLYKITSASLSYYHVIWLQPTSSIDNFDLYLYDDANYSNLIAKSCNGKGSLDWVIFRPNTSQAYYPKVYAESGDGSAYIEWDYGYYTYSYPTSIGSYMDTNDRIELYQVYLYTSRTYDFSLRFSSYCDFDLFLYYLNPGNATNSFGYIACSNTSGYGVDEEISGFKPPYDGAYVLLISCSAGSGSFSLYIDYLGSYGPYIDYNFIYSFILMISLVGIVTIVIIVIAVAYRNRERQRRQQRYLPQQQARRRLQEERALERARIQRERRQAQIQRDEYLAHESRAFIYCPLCGARNKRTEIFCERCGASL